MLKAKRIISFLLVIIMAFSCFMFVGCDILENILNQTQNNSGEPSGDSGNDGDEGHDDFISSIGGVSETFTGGVSKVSYTDVDKAATAFVENEISGEKDVEIIATVSKGNLSKEKIDSLGIPQADKEGIVSVEEIEVEYAEETPSAQGANGFALNYKGTLNTSKKVKVYIIKYPNEFKYYTPCPVTGDTLNKSYYDSVFDMEKYKNCTYNTSMTMEMNMVIPGEGSMDIDMTITQKMAITETAILLEQVQTGTISDGDTTEPANYAIYAYIVNGQDGIVCYISTDKEEWFQASLTQIGFSDYEELTPFYDQYLDYTYFKKTNYGFELSEENAQQFINKTLSDELAGLGAQVDGLNFDIDLFVKYYVREGVLTGAREDVVMNMSVSEGDETMTMDYVIVAEMTVSNYGSTVVEQPFDDVA